MWEWNSDYVSLRPPSYRLNVSSSLTLFSGVIFSKPFILPDSPLGHPLPCSVCEKQDALTRVPNGAFAAQVRGVIPSLLPTRTPPNRIRPRAFLADGPVCWYLLMSSTQPFHTEREWSCFFSDESSESSKQGAICWCLFINWTLILIACFFKQSSCVEFQTLVFRITY